MKCLFALFLTFFYSDRLITRLPFITQTSPMVTHPIWETISTCGPSVHLRLIPHTASNTNKNPHTRTHLHTLDEGHREAERKCLDVLRHLLGPSGRWWANQAACCLCHSPPPCTTLVPASWRTWQLASWTWNSVACWRKAHERPPLKEFISDFSKWAKENTAGKITGQHRVKSNLAP